jgi:hypothetical protein
MFSPWRKLDKQAEGLREGSESHIKRKIRGTPRIFLWDEQRDNLTHGRAP